MNDHQITQLFVFTYLLAGIAMTFIVLAKNWDYAMKRKWQIIPMGVGMIFLWFPIVPIYLYVEHLDKQQGDGERYDG